MKATELAIPGPILFEPEVFEDQRGLFYESFSLKFFESAIGNSVGFVQDNHSSSGRGVLRGMHFQNSPFMQGKLVRVIRGAAFDVAVDLREASSTFGRWTAEELTAKNRRQLWIPEGFAHGFLALEDNTELIYKATSYYSAAHEGVINWKAFGIAWPISIEPILSERDASASFDIEPVMHK